MERFAAAASAARDALRRVLREMEPGKLISELCALGDDFIREEASLAEARLALDEPLQDEDGEHGQNVPEAPRRPAPAAARGRTSNVDSQALEEIASRLSHIGFPTCITPNPMLGDYSPSSKAASLTLQPGTVYKVKLATLVKGAYGYAATTVVLSAEKPYFGQPIEGDIAAALAACHVLTKVLPSYFRPGVLSTKIAGHIQRITSHFGVRPVVGVNCEIVSENAREFLDHNFVPTTHLPPSYESDPPFRLFPDCAVVIDLMLSCGDVEPEAEQRPPCVYHVDSNLLTFAPSLGGAPPFKDMLLPRLNGRGMLGHRETGMLRILQQHHYPFTARCLGPRTALQGLNPISAYLLPFSLARLKTKDFVQVGIMLYIGADRTYALNTPLLPNIIRSRISPTPDMLEEMAGRLVVPNSACPGHRKGRDHPGGDTEDPESQDDSWSDQSSQSGPLLTFPLSSLI